MAGIIDSTKMKRSKKVIEDDKILKELPTRLVSCLMPFQKEGVMFAVRKNGRCLIADEMGLGKTLQAIAVACHFKSEWPLLIIVPSSLRYAWIEELEKWLPDILPDDINLIQGGFDTGGIAEAKITIVTYGLLSCKSSATVKEALRARQFNVVICDESHYFKNSRTECCKAVSPLLTAAKRCLLLSGTPALARPSELFSQLDALLPGKFGSFWSFTKKYCDGRWQHFGRRRQWRVDGASNLDELQKRLASIMIRREKSSVLTQLPPKQRQKILFPLKDSQTKKEILSTFAELKPLLKKSNSTLAANLLGDGRNVGTGPEGVHATEQQDTNTLSRIQRLYNLTGEAKIGPAREYIQMLCENVNLKFLVFAYHHSMMNGLQQTLWDKKVKFVRIDGQTRPSDRQLYVQQFQSDKNTRVAILSILAAGVGLTLTQATLVVFAELYWTPGVMVQCEDRAHRIGQTSTVPIHYLVARETMDEWVWSAVCRKTLVTTTALTGKTRSLQADAGDHYQVELLSAAEAYRPAENAEIDVLELVQSQLPPDQKSILDFFSSQTEPSQSTASSSQPLSHSGSNSSQNSDPDLSLVESDLSSTCSTPRETNRKATPSETSRKPTPSETSRKATPSETSRKATPCGKIKKIFPLFGSLTKQQSKAQPVQESVLIDSSDEETAQVSQKANLREVETKPVVLRKRKCTVSYSVDGSSDSEFEQAPSGFSYSEPKKKKLSSKSKLKTSFYQTPNSSKKCVTKNDSISLTKTVNKDISCAASDSLSLETNAGAEKGKYNEKEWSCSACTFSNSSLLPFCEMCETPRKRKEKVELNSSQQTKTSTSAAAGVKATANCPPSFSERNGMVLSPPLCSSTQLSKQNFGAKSGGSRTKLEQESARHDSVSLVSCQLSHFRHKAKRTLLLDVDEIDSDVIQTEYDQTGKSSVSGYWELETAESDGQSAYSPGKSQMTPVVSECSKLKSFQQESSSEKFSECSSPLFEGEKESEVESEKENENKSFGSHDSEHVSLFSSPESVYNSSKEEPTVGNVTSHVSDTCKETGASFSSDKIDTALSDNYVWDSDDDLVEASYTASTETPEVSSCNLPVVKRPKRRCFMLEPQHKDSVNTLSHPSGGKALESASVNSSAGSAQSGGEMHTETSQARKISAVTDERIDMKMLEDTDDPQCGEKQSSSCKLHNFFLFCCSAYTGRVYIFDENGQSLKANFLPLDVELDNVTGLPDLLHQPPHLRLAQNFVRQWNSLTDTKRRLIIKRGLKFRNPLAAYDQVRTDLANNKQRYMTKEDQVRAAMKTAKEVNGSVRVLSKHHRRPALASRVPDGSKSHPGSGSDSGQTGSQNWPKGYVQVMSADGIPLCLHCNQACSSLVSKETLQKDDNAWHTRFCSRVCADAHWMKTNTAYLRSSVYDIQHGVCQLCNFDAHTFFCQIRDSPDVKERVEKINNSRFNRLGAKQKKQMAARPYEGLFWHVDHIRPVWEGGGQCDIDNLRTLCTTCHLSITSKQAAKRAQARRLSKAAYSGDISAFFKKT